MAKYEHLQSAYAEFGTTLYPEVAATGREFGKKVKAERLNASTAIAFDLYGADENARLSQGDAADAYGMSRGSIQNYAKVGILAIVDPKVDRQKAYTLVSRNENAPTTDEVKDAAEKKAAGDRRSVLTILNEIIDDREIVPPVDPTDPTDPTDEVDEVEGGKARVYLQQADEALVNLLREKTDVSEITLDEVNTLAAQVSALAARVRKATAPLAVAN